MQVYLVAVVAICQLRGQPFPCDRNHYIALTPAVGQTTQLQRWAFNPGNGQPLFDPVAMELNVVVNAIGYSVMDGHIYGLDPLNGNLYRINSSGGVTDLGVPNGLNLEYEYYAGEIAPNGQNIFVIGRTRDTKVDRVMYSIGLQGPSYNAGYVSIVCDWASSIGDIAFSPVFGILVGFDNATRRLVDVSTGGNVTSSLLGGNSQLNMGSLFFNEDGQLYGYGSTGGPENQLYRINISNGQVTPVGSWVTGRFTDGCSCPYRISFNKIVLPNATLPCTEVIYRYEIYHTAGIPYSQVELKDTLPPDFEILSVSGLSSLSIVESGPGSHILHIRKVQTLLDLNVIEVVVRVGDQPGVYASNAYLGPFPFALGSLLISDDPAQPGDRQPTPLTIIEAQDLIADSLLFLCDGAARQIFANPTADSYAWSNGQTTAGISVDTAGVYILEATTACGVYIDTVFIEPVTAPLWVELGEDKLIQAGDELILFASSNAGDSVLYTWSVTGDSAMSCRDCVSPRVAPLVNTVYTVSINDDNGCTAFDSLFVEVLPTRRLYIPNAFSPNNDGINDIFYLQGKGAIAINSLRIFDRWGNQVFELKNGTINDQALGWDGNFRGKPVLAGVYIYTAIITLWDDSQEILSGEFHLFR